MAKLVTLHDADGEVIYPQTISDMDYSTSEQDMAIDDNTSYELAGYQVKDLAGRIRR